MTALQTPQKTSRRQELRQNKLVELYARLLLLWEERRTLVYVLIGAVVAAGLAVPGYLYYQQQQQRQANEALGQILPVYEQGNYQQALDGTSDARGLLAIASDYGGTPAGNLARYYAATALYQQGEYDRALSQYQQFDKEDDYIGASALAAEAAIYENRGEFETAGQHYEEAADQYESELTTPRYLLRAGRAYEEAGAFSQAESAYQRIRDNYSDTPQARTAAQAIARVEARRTQSAS
jgi:tetratricopeptide (TPR) repeat protein